jgi:hypothetical protein
MTTGAFLDPPSAIAAGICLTARALDPERRLAGRHLRECGWCFYPTEALAELVAAFNAWAGFHERSRTYARHEARIFAELPRDQQAALVLAAQGFEPEAEPAEDLLEAESPPPADASPALEELFA